jgi:hypothetical protein
MIDNPDYKPMPDIYLFPDIKFVGFELWQVRNRPPAALSFACCSPLSGERAPFWEERCARPFPERGAWRQLMHMRRQSRGGRGRGLQHQLPVMETIMGSPLLPRF